VEEKKNIKNLMWSLFDVFFIILLCYLFYQWGYSDALSKVINTNRGLYDFCVRQLLERLP